MSGGEGLVVRDLHVRYGKVPAVRDASLAVAPGEVVALVGPNSAGKSSLLQGIGVRSPWRRVSGSVHLDGRRIDGRPTHARWSAGLRLVPQGREIFPSLTVEENLRVVAENLGVEWSRAIGMARRRFPAVFVERLDVAAGNLSGGEQQMLALARALIGEPRFVLLDEPGLGLAQRIVRELGAVIRELNQSGLGILLADQSIEPWSGIADRAYTIVRGEIVRPAGEAGG